MSFPSFFQLEPGRAVRAAARWSRIMLAAVETTQDCLNATLGRRVRADIDNIFPYRQRCFFEIFVALLRRVVDLEFQKVIILHLRLALAGILCVASEKIARRPRELVPGVTMGRKSLSKHAPKRYDCCFFMTIEVSPS
jgi:hypothetical protein